MPSLPACRFKNKVVPLLFKLMPAFMGHLGNNSVLDEGEERVPLRVLPLRLLGCSGGSGAVPHTQRTNLTRHSSPLPPPADVIFLHMQEQEAVRRGMGAKPAGQVYFMPAASDAYVAAFR